VYVYVCVWAAVCCVCDVCDVCVCVCMNVCVHVCEGKHMFSGCVFVCVWLWVWGGRDMCFVMPVPLHVPAFWCRHMFGSFIGCELSGLNWHSYHIQNISLDDTAPHCGLSLGTTHSQLAACPHLFSCGRWRQVAEAMYWICCWGNTIGNGRS
jgi:hypothetical protein